jgi:hypothetical protein
MVKQSLNDAQSHDVECCKIFQRWKKNSLMKNFAELERANFSLLILKGDALMKSIWLERLA